ncbi:hypothetical protein RHGRI_015802 [Rhododendron griersonianum]|uniref:Uncharacterized protein n=1 Tax=Rhododendron griersonianum TaxID=479676 RepID=A0AAV6JNK5_9ERIC|nr:hypothetical protein RHGRI_015802 [Rhododendron griersonianum]
MVNTARHSTGKASYLKSGESFDPHYLRASTGSCHDFCKYGRKHEVELKARHPFPKRAIKLPFEMEINPTVVVVSAERKMTAVVKVKPKPSPVSNALSADSLSVIKQEVSSLSSDTVGLKLEPFPNIDIVKSWINTAMKHNVQKLELQYLEEFNGEIPLQLPQTMFISKTLVDLTLDITISLKIPPSVWLPSLKIL